MDVTTQRRCLRVIAAALFLTTLAAIGWSLSGVAGTEGEVVADSTPPIRQATSDEIAQTIDERIVARPLRGPLYDPPPPPPSPPTPQPTEPTPRAQPQLDLTLVGTIIEPDHSLAILADASGKFDVKGIGEPLELSPQGVTLQDIESEQVTLQYRGRESTVVLDRSRIKPAGNDTRRNNRRRRP